MLLSEIEAIFAPAIKSLDAMNIKARVVLADIQDMRREAEALQACAEKARREFAEIDRKALRAQIQASPEQWI